MKDALDKAGAFDVHETEPKALRTALRSAVEGGATRVLVAGGDGTLRSAASVLAGTPVELAVLPAGTLNHFAKYLGMPTDPSEAAALASTGAVRTVDVGSVNGRVILNTSSVGAYVTFVRVRNRVETHLAYRAASLIALARVIAHLHTLRVVVDAGGQHQVYSTPLVFVGIGEREIGLPMLGARVPGGRRGLHILVVRGKRRAQLLLRAVAVATRGLHTLPRTSREGIDSFLTDRCLVEMRGGRTRVGIDGEIIRMRVPLHYRIARDALRVVAPPEGAG